MGKLRLLRLIAGGDGLQDHVDLVENLVGVEPLQQVVGVAQVEGLWFVGIFHGSGGLILKGDGDGALDRNVSGCLPRLALLCRPSGVTFRIKEYPVFCVYCQRDVSDQARLNQAGKGHAFPRVSLKGFLLRYDGGFHGVIFDRWPRST